MQTFSQKMLPVSDQLFAKAQQVIPGGVNSPVRAYKAVGGMPAFVQSAKGAYVTDVDGRRYIDYVGSWGPMILGHSHPAVLEAVTQAIQKGLSFGAPCAAEVTLAEEVCQLIPSIEKVRMVNSGTEATMSAIRLARGATGRDKIVKFEGCYHGHADSLLVKAGSGALTLGVPSSPGVPAGSTQDTLVADFNNLDSVTALFEQYGQQIACIIVEPIAGNMNLVLPTPGFLQGLREICDQYQSLLIFDEVISGFRVGLQGAQGLYSIRPDITALGKILGAGMPVGAFGGRADVMDQLAPIGPVYQAGTLSGNPVAMTAGLAALKELQKPGTYERLQSMTESLVAGVKARAKQAGVPVIMNQATGIFGLFFTKEQSVTQYQQVMACDTEKFTRYFQAMLQAGIWLGPSAFESGFVSLAHTDQEIEQTLSIVERVFAEIS